MFCSRCGAGIPDGSSFCAKCGAPINDTVSQNNVQQNYAQQSNTQCTYSTPANHTNPNLNQSEGMGWYKFMINFALFAGAVINFVYGILYCSGDIYDVFNDIEHEFIYAIFPRLQTTDIIYGIFLIALAGFAKYVRVRLKNFYRNAPTCLYILCAAALAIPVIYIIITSSITGIRVDELMDSSSLGSIVGSITALVINVVYFDKRKYMFVN